MVLADPPVRGAAPGPEEAAELAARRDLLVEALTSLPEHYRRPVYLRHVEGWSYEELARLDRTTLAAIRTRLLRGRRELRERVEALARERGQWPLAAAPLAWLRLRLGRARAPLGHAGAGHRPDAGQRRAGGGGGLDGCHWARCNRSRAAGRRAAHPSQSPRRSATSLPMSAPAVSRATPRNTTAPVPAERTTPRPPDVETPPVARRCQARWQSPITRGSTLAGLGSIAATRPGRWLRQRVESLLGLDAHADELPVRDVAEPSTSRPGEEAAAVVAVHDVTSGTVIGDPPSWALT